MKWQIGFVVALGAATVYTLSGAQAVTAKGIATSSPQRKDKVVMTDKQWQAKLNKEHYEILRAKGTEPAFCGVNLDQKGEGVYHCVGCDLPLFVAEAKFNSGTGWPSFFQPFSKENVWFKIDRTYGMIRTEVLCSRCDGHLGHVFNDGPKPTGLRYCINGKIMQFKKTEKGK
jgi:peptide-methionine (R)-S-oxide reductase